MTSFSELKRNSNNSFDKLNKELAKINAPSQSKDDRLWTPTRDKAGNASAVIRFLPAPPGEDMPFVRLWSHAFKGPGGWMIENSPTTIGKECPISDLNRKLWEEGEGSPGRKRVQGSGRDNPGTKRTLSYYANIYVVKDPANPESEGKTFIYKFGKKIFDKLNDAMNPVEDPLEPKSPINPFDLWDGANFKLSVRMVEGYPNYDKSEFYAVGPLLEDDDKLEQIWKSEYSLQEFVAPDKFKSYADLEKRLAKVLGTAAPSPAAVDDEEDDVPFTPTNTSPAERFNKKPAPKKAAVDDDEDELAFLAQLAAED